MSSPPDWAYPEIGAFDDNQLPLERTLFELQSAKLEYPCTEMMTYPAILL